MKEFIEYHDQTKAEQEQMNKYEERFIEHDPYGAFSQAMDMLNKRIAYLERILRSVPRGLYDYKLVTGYEGTDLSLESLIETKDFYAQQVERAVDFFDEHGSTREDEKELEDKVEAYYNVTTAVFLDMMTIVPSGEGKQSVEYLENLIAELERVRDLIGKKRETLPKPSLPKPSLN